MSLTKSKLILMLPFVLAGCASPPPVVHKPPQVPPLPLEISTKREANLVDRLTKLLVIEGQVSQSAKP
jgi:hypothetical protein